MPRLLNKAGFKTRLSLLLPLVLLWPLLLAPAGCAKTNKTTLVVYNWGEYIANETDTYTLGGQEYEITDVIADFEAAYPQYDVVYKTFDDNEKMYPVLEKESFDVVVPSDYMVVRLLREGKLLPLDFAKMPNVAQYLDPKLKTLQFDTDKAISDQVFNYAVPYMYCTVGMIYNQTELGPIDSQDPKIVWQSLLDPAHKGQIGMYNSMRESIGMALNYLGYSLNSLDPAELDAAKQLLIKQRKEVQPIVGIDELKDKFVNGELLAGIAWSGDHVVCQQRLEEGGQDPEMLQYVLPAGSNLSVDMFVVPKNARNPEGAMAFINYMYDPAVALKNAVYVGYSTPHIDVVAKLPEAIAKNLSYYPDTATMASLEIYYSNDEIDQTYDQIWQTVMAN